MNPLLNKRLSFQILISLTLLTLSGCIYDDESIVHPGATQAALNSDITLAINVSPARGIMLDFDDHLWSGAFPTDPRTFKDHRDILNLLKPYKTQDQRNMHSEDVYVTFSPPFVPGQAWTPLRIGHAKPIDHDGSRSFRANWNAGTDILGGIQYGFEDDAISHSTCEDLLPYDVVTNKPTALVDLQERDDKLYIVQIRPTIHPRPHIGDDPC
jgi:hypothetical protein